MLQFPHMNEIPQLVVTGSISLDRIMNFGGRYQDLIQPDKLHTLSLSVLINELSETHGGTGANIAYTSALLGEHPVLLGSVGPNATDYLEELRILGVDVSHIHKSSLQTATFTVLTDRVNNQVGGFFLGAMEDTDSISLSPWKDTHATVVVSPNTPSLMKRLVREAKQYHLALVYDPGQQVTNSPAEDLAAGVQAADVLMTNDYELTMLSRRIGIKEDVIRATVPIVVTTLGERGSLITGAKGRESIHVSAVSGVHVVDPTGAGDAFRGGFLHGYRRGRDLTTCGRMGSVSAAYTVEQVGTQTHHFTPAEFTARYQTAYDEVVEL